MHCEANRKQWADRTRTCSLRFNSAFHALRSFSLLPVPCKTPIINPNQHNRKPKYTVNTRRQRTPTHIHSIQWDVNSRIIFPAEPQHVWHQRRKPIRLGGSSSSCRFLNYFQNQQKLSSTFATSSLHFHHPLHFKTIAKSINWPFFPPKRNSKDCLTSNHKALKLTKISQKTNQNKSRIHRFTCIPTTLNFKTIIAISNPPFILSSKIKPKNHLNSHRQPPKLTEVQNSQLLLNFKLQTHQHNLKSTTISSPKKKKFKIP